MKGKFFFTLKHSGSNISNAETLTYRKTGKKSINGCIEEKIKVKITETNNIMKKKKKELI